MFTSWKWIAMGIALLAITATIGTLSVKVSNRNTTIAEQKTEISKWQDNCTAQAGEIKDFQTDQAQKKVTIASLQKQITDASTTLSNWQLRVREQDKVIANMHSKPAAPAQDAKEVLDDESSSAVLDNLNGLFTSAGLFSQGGSASGGSSGSATGVHQVPAPAETHPGTSGQERSSGK